MAVMTFEEPLAAWLPGQRWFAGKGTPITDLAVVAQTTLISGDPGLRHLIVAVTQASGTDSYQLFLGLRADLPDRLEHVRIGPVGPGPDRLRRPARPRPDGGAAGGDGRRGVDRAASLRPPSGRADRHRPGEPGAHRRAEQHQPAVRRGGHPQGVPQALLRPQPRPGGARRPGQDGLPARGRAAGLDHRADPGPAHGPRRAFHLPAERGGRLVPGRDQRPRLLRERDHERGAGGRGLLRRGTPPRRGHRRGAP